MQIVVEKELELSQHVANLNASTLPDSYHKSLPGSEHNYSPHMTFYDVRVVRLIRKFVNTGTTLEDSTPYSG